MVIIDLFIPFHGGASNGVFHLHDIKGQFEMSSWDLSVYRRALSRFRLQLHLPVVPTSLELFLILTSTLPQRYFTLLRSYLQHR
jgi:hypothetical protein